MSIHIPSILLALPRNPVVALGLPLALGGYFGRGATNSANNKWYYGLKTVPGRPPRAAFPFVWTALYLCMGWASHIAVKSLDSAVLQSDKDALSLGIALYYFQLGLSFIYAPLFFDKREIGWALVDSIIATAATWYMTSILNGPTAAHSTYFLLPYCTWLGFATYLNAGACWLNRDKQHAD